MSRSITPRRAVGAGVVAALAAATLVSATGTANAAPGATAAASPALGVNTGGNVVSVAGTGFTDANGADAVDTPVVVLGTATTAPTCSSSTVASGTTVSSYSVVSGTRIVLTMPSAGSISTASVKAAVCFAVTGGTTYVTIPYTFAKPVTFPGTRQFSPAGGPLVGGQTVTMYTDGTSVFQAAATVLVGGQLASGVKVATDGKSLTFVTPVGSSSGAKVVTLRTAGFPDIKIKNGASGVTTATQYTYTRAITVSPAAGSTTSATPITVTGTGFLSDFYDPDGNDVSDLKVFLSDGQQWVQGATPATDPAVAAVPVACANVQVISDTELTCKVPSGTAGALRVIVTDGTWAARTPANDTGVSRGAIFVRADF